MSLDSNKLIIWRYTDGRAGHDSQSLGLSNAICRLAECELFEIKTPSTLFTLGCFLRDHPATDSKLPNPTLIMGAGRKTHLPVLASKKAVGGKSLILMRPTLPYSFYDYCLVPDHDTPPVLKNVISTAGALNTIVPAVEKDPQLGVIMVGGPSRYFDWQDDAIVSVIEKIIHRGLTKWAVFDSPRTPDSTRIRIKDIKAADLNYFSYQNCPGETLKAKLVKAANVWVTADSVSMLYEALTAGAPTGVIPVPNKKPNKISSSLEILNYEGQCTSYKEWYDGRPLTAPGKKLNEADRCAKIILNGLARSV